MLSVLQEKIVLNLNNKFPIIIDKQLTALFSSLGADLMKPTIFYTADFPISSVAWKESPR